MAKVFRCVLVDRMEFDLVAEDVKQAQDWLNMQGMENVMAQTNNYDMEYGYEVLYEVTDLTPDMVSVTAY